MKTPFIPLALAILATGCQSIQTPTSDVTSTDPLASAIENRKDIKPLIIVSPKYPKSEMAMGVEGSCKVSFDLDDMKFRSKPTNVKAIDCSNDHFFAACKTSLDKWLFNAIDKLGTRESTKGLVTTCQFTL